MGTRYEEQCSHETAEARSVDRRERAVPYSVPTVLLSEYLRHGATLSGPGALFLRKSRRNTATR